MKRIIFLIVVLGLALWGFNRFVDTSEENQPTGEDLSTFKGKIYIPPKGAPFEEFFMDQTGQVYGLSSEEAPEGVIRIIERSREISSFVEIKGDIKENPDNPEEKEIIIKEIKEIEREEADCPPCICP